MKNKSIKNIIWAVAAQAASILSGLAVTKLILLSYGSAVNGLINGINQIFAYFVLLEAGVGAASLQLLYKPAAEGRQGEMARIMRATSAHYKRMGIVYLAAVIAIAFAYPLLLAVTGSDEGIESWITAGIVLCIGLGNVANFIYQGRYKILLAAEGKNYVVSASQTVYLTVSAFLKSFAIIMWMDVIFVMIVGLICQIGLSVFYALYARRHYGWLKQEGEAAIIPQRGSVMVHQVSQLIFANTDVLILTFACGLELASVYAVYKVVVSAISSLTYQLSESVLYRLGQDFSSGRERYLKDIDSFDAIYTAVSFALLAAAYILYRPFIVLYTGSIGDAVYDMKWLPELFIAIELLSGVRRAMQNTINVAGHFKATLPRTIAETVINLGVSLALVPWLGIYGVLIGTIAALIYRSNDIIIYGNRRILGRSPLASYRIYAVYAAAFIPAVIAGRLIDMTFGNYLHFVIAGVIVTAAAALWFGFVTYIFFGKKIDIRRFKE